MDNALTWLYWWLAVINTAAFVLCGADKSRARKRRGRVPEKTLFLLAALGGSPGLWLGMYAFRHKTRHMSFVLGIPAILAVQLGIAWLALWR